MEDKKAPEPPIGVRLPADLRQYVQAKAKESFRSLSAEIASRVERTRRLDQQDGAAQ